MNKKSVIYRINHSAISLAIPTPANFSGRSSIIMISHPRCLHTNPSDASGYTTALISPPSIRKQTQINTFNTYTKHTSITQQRTAHLLSLIFIATGMEIDQHEDYILWNTRRHTVTQIRRRDKLRGDISVIRVV